LRKKAPGRGESVCMRKACLKKVKGIQLPEVAALIGADVLNTLGLVRRQNRLSLGADSVSKLLAEDGASCAFISSESAERTHKDVRFAAEQSEEQKGLRVVLIPATQDDLAQAVGRGIGVGVLGVDAVTLRHGMCSGLKEKALLWQELQGYGEAN